MERQDQWPLLPSIFFLNYTLHSTSTHSPWYHWFFCFFPFSSNSQCKTNLDIPWVIIMLQVSWPTLPAVAKILPSCEKSRALISLWGSSIFLKDFHVSKSQHVIIPSAPYVKVEVLQSIINCYNDYYIIIVSTIWIISGLQLFYLLSNFIF